MRRIYASSLILSLPICSFVVLLLFFSHMRVFSTLCRCLSLDSYSFLFSCSDLVHCAFSLFCLSCLGQLGLAASLCVAQWFSFDTRFLLVWCVAVACVCVCAVFSCLCSCCCRCCCLSVMSSPVCHRCCSCLCLLSRRRVNIWDASHNHVLLPLLVLLVGAVINAHP